MSVSRHFLLQAPQCPWSVRKRFSRDHCCRERPVKGRNVQGAKRQRGETSCYRVELSASPVQVLGKLEYCIEATECFTWPTSAVALFPSLRSETQCRVKHHYITLHYIKQCPKSLRTARTLYEIKGVMWEYSYVGKHLEKR